MAIVMVTVFLSSCEKEVLPTDKTEVYSDEISESHLESRSPCFTDTGNCAEDCESCFNWLNKQDNIARNSQIHNCVMNGGDLMACGQAANEWYQRALADNKQYLSECLKSCPQPPPPPNDCDNIELVYEGKDKLVFSLRGSCEDGNGRIIFQSEYREPGGSWIPFHIGTVVNADYPYPAILNLPPCTTYEVRFRIECDGEYGEWCQFTGTTQC